MDNPELWKRAEAAGEFGGGAAGRSIASDLWLGKEVSMMCVVLSEVAFTATTREFAAI